MFKFLRKPPPIQDLVSLADFVEQQAAFVTQKGIYEYSRARAGHYAKVLFGESEFIQAVEVSRWGAYPLGLAMVAEAVEGALRPHVGDERRAALDALMALVLSVFDRHAAPAAIGETGWADARSELARRLDLIGTHAVKFAKDIPEPFAQLYFDLMPIHAKLRGNDFPTIRNYLRVTLCNIHDELMKRADIPALAQALRS